MKNTRIFLILFAVIILPCKITAQTADEIIDKYLQAVGGKDKISKMTSQYYEASIDAMGMAGTMKMTILNGKGMRQDIDISGSILTNCFTDKGGWSINPFMGSTGPEVMPEAQYNQGKDNIFIEAPLINYKERGYKVELLGQEQVAGVNAFKVKFTSPENHASTYFFDPNTFYCLRTIQESENQGQVMQNVMTYSDFRQTEGYTQPYKMEMNMADGQFTMTMTITKVEFNKPVSDSLFVKP